LKVSTPEKNDFNCQSAKSFYLAIAGKRTAYRLIVEGLKINKMFSNVLEIPYEKISGLTNKTMTSSSRIARSDATSLVGQILGLGSFGVVTKVNLEVLIGVLLSQQ